MMKTNKPRALPHVYIYLFIIVICVVSLMQAGARISSSHYLNHNAPHAADGTINSKPAVELEHLLFQAPAQGLAGKIAPQLLDETVDGKSSSIVIFLADQADVS